jgi:hypothetical protein
MISWKRIFISHSSEDNSIARIIVDELERRGCNVWYDEYNLDFGRIRQKIDESLSTCQVIIILLSEGALKSLWVNREIDAGLALEARPGGMLIVPALVSPCVVPPILSGYKRLNFMDGSDYEAEIDLFMNMLDQKPNGPHISSPISPETSRIKEATPQHPLGGNIISGNISGRDVRIHQGDSISINHTSVPSFLKVENRDDSFSQFNSLVDELSSKVKAGRNIDALSLEQFLSFMSDVNAQSVVLSPQLIQQVRALCKQLRLTTLI